MKRDAFVLEKQSEPVSAINLDGSEFTAEQARALVLAKEAEDTKNERKKLEKIIKEYAIKGSTSMYIFSSQEAEYERHKAYFESLGYRYKYMSFFGHFKSLDRIEWGE